MLLRKKMLANEQLPNYFHGKQNFNAKTLFNTKLADLNPLVYRSLVQKKFEVLNDWLRLGWFTAHDIAVSNAADLRVFTARLKNFDFYNRVPIYMVEPREKQSTPMYSGVKLFTSILCANSECERNFPEVNRLKRKEETSQRCSNVDKTPRKHSYERVR